MIYMVYTTYYRFWFSSSIASFSGLNACFEGLKTFNRGPPTSAQALLGRGTLGFQELPHKIQVAWAQATQVQIDERPSKIPSK